jgi:glutamine cyclotransferase
MKRQNLAIALIVLIIALSTVTVVLLNNQVEPSSQPEEPIEQETTYYTYSVMNVFPHDEDAFTQGLVYEDGVLYEGTGRYGQSSLRRVDLETGEVTQIHTLPNNLFGEGITIFEDRIIQLTWKSHTGFVYDKNSFELLQEFEYTTEGWGITNNGTTLIMSDGTSTLYFLDSVTFRIVNQVEVYDNQTAVTMLNELEYINGRVYANVWLDNRIAIINPETGQVTGWIDLSEISEPEKFDSDSVLNGIAYDQDQLRLFVTGKNWSHIYEISIDS